MSEELKPCPFCGGGVRGVREGIPDDMRHITTFRCGQCGSSGPAHSVRSIFPQNGRPIEDALRKRVAELEAELEEEKARSSRLAISLSDRIREREAAEAKLARVNDTVEEIEGKDARIKKLEAELEDEKATVSRLATGIYYRIKERNEAKRKLANARERVEELEALFDKQHERTHEADERWRRATGNHDSIPDLGELIDWLMSEKDAAEAKLCRAMCVIQDAYEGNCMPTADDLNLDTRKPLAVVEGWYCKTCGDLCYGGTGNDAEPCVMCGGTPIPAKNIVLEKDDD